ncbi:MAG: bifunctional nicotinamidase/pyrazinamidase [bacterium]|nr:bifunctional nicotinamidase/pyrazinamidase [bacterium]
MKALLLVDLQNDFLPGGALAVPSGDDVIPVANLLMLHFDRVVATQDWHPADHGSFAANHPGREQGDLIELGGQPQVLWPVHCVQGSPGAELAPDLERPKIERVFFKGIDREVDSYSAFFDNAASRSTGLGEYLRRSGIGEIFIMGLATDYCVQFSALDAVQLGFATSVIEDGCRGVDLTPGDSERAVEAMHRSGVEIISSGEVLTSGTQVHPAAALSANV